MSLRGFHILFITLSVLLSLGVAFFQFSAYNAGHQTVDGVIALVCVLNAVLLGGYGIYFLRKSRRLHL